MVRSRRQFIKNTSAASCALPFIEMCSPSLNKPMETGALNISIFSKHLQFLDYKETGNMASEVVFDGVDLTVRPKGHVLPENATTDLPRAINKIREGGSICELITTSIVSVENSIDLYIIKTGGKNGISHYRIHWYGSETPPSN